MTIIDDIEYTEKGKSKFYKVIAEGRTYRAFEDSLAFGQFKQGEFKKGDHVDLRYTEVPSKTDSNIVHKNLNRIERLNIPIPSPQTASKAPDEAKSSTAITSAGDYWADKSKRDVETQKSITMSGAINSAIEFFKMNGARIPGNEPINQETVEKVADFFYEKIRAKMQGEKSNDKEKA